MGHFSWLNQTMRVFIYLTLQLYITRVTQEVVGQIFKQFNYSPNLVIVSDVIVY